MTLPKEQEVATPELATPTHEDRIYVATQWQLMWWRFRKHKMAMVGTALLIVLYLIAIFCEFIAPYDPNESRKLLSVVQAQGIHFFEEGKLVRPYVYGYLRKRDPVTLRLTYTEDPEKKYPVRLFAHGTPYKFWGLIDSDVHLFGVDGEDATFFVFGTDTMGRDVFTRIMYGTRISMSVGLVSIAFSFALGITLGGIAGYYGGTADILIGRVIEFLRSIPTIPLWMGLSAALPVTWPPLRVYFGITIILSLIGWTGLAQVVRSRFLSLREEDFVMAARLSGAGELRIIMRHLVPSFMSYIIASLTLSIPGMILSETSLSFLGLGLRPPVVSWGVLLQEAQNLHAVALAPWLLIPGLFVVVSVLAFNFMGDGLRDAADPYSR